MMPYDLESPLLIDKQSDFNIILTSKKYKLAVDILFSCFF